MRLALVLAAAAVVLLAGCTGPVDADPPSPHPTTTDPGVKAWALCDDATMTALSADLEGQLVLEPDDSLAGPDFGDAVTYPDFLPPPSCIAYPTGQGLTVAFFLGATEDDLASFESTIVEHEADPPTPVVGIEPPVIAAETWPMGPVVDLRYLDASNGVSQPYLQVTSVFSSVVDGG